MRCDNSLQTEKIATFMSQFIGDDAHRMYSVFAAVNEERVPEEAIGVKHRREDYLKFLDASPGDLVIALRANGYRHCLVDEIQRTSPPDQGGLVR